VVNYAMSPRALHRLREASAERGKGSIPPGLSHGAYRTVGFTHGYSNLPPSGILFFLRQGH
jgi:hypothetical protein